VPAGGVHVEMELKLLLNFGAVAVTAKSFPDPGPHPHTGSPLQVVRYINVPLLGSTIRLTVFLSVLGSLQYFDLIWIMSGGGPVHASETMATYLMRYGFQSFSMGYGSAVGVIMFGLCFVFSFMYQRLIMTRDLAGSITKAQV